MRLSLLVPSAPLAKLPRRTVASSNLCNGGHYYWVFLLSTPPCLAGFTFNGGGMPPLDPVCSPKQESIQLAAPPNAVVYQFTTESERRVEWLGGAISASPSLAYLLRLPLSEMSNIKYQLLAS